MGTICTERRHDNEQVRYLEHAIDLVRTHGWRYAVAYLRNQRVAEATLQRVLFGEWGRRRSIISRLIIFQQLRLRYR
ncbi:hypothetical protein ACHMW6_18430 [Pseudoduganella sp. UC29_106]|uniref:hypothetical protein n=1 Tax=Pseudoduganella sp. UC29_106 TaxID=3374553 RepID=UPI003756E023